MELLKAKILMKEEEKVGNDKKQDYQRKGDNSWSNQVCYINVFVIQIRSYVLHPYKMVKDHHFDVTESNVTKILEGDLWNYLEEIMSVKWIRITISTE